MRYSLIQDLENTKKIWYKVEDDTNNTRNGNSNRFDTLWSRTCNNNRHLGKHVPQIDLFRYIEKVGKKQNLKKKAASSISPFEKSSRCRIECRKRTYGNCGSCYFSITSQKWWEYQTTYYYTSSNCRSSRSFWSSNLNVYKEIEKKLSLG